MEFAGRAEAAAEAATEVARTTVDGLTAGAIAPGAPTKG